MTIALAASSESVSLPSRSLILAANEIYGSILEHNADREARVFDEDVEWAVLVDDGRDLAFEMWG